MSNLHFIIDYETIGQDVFNIPMLNASYYVFDWDRFTSDTPYTFEELVRDIKFFKADIAKQVENGRKFKQSDLKWWQDQGPEARKQIKPCNSDRTVVEFLDEVEAYLKGTKLTRWWSRSNCFDPVLLQRDWECHYTNDALNKILPFWKLRDVRTYIDTRFNFDIKFNNFCPFESESEWNKVFVKHNSTHDVAADILRIQRIERLINE